MSDRIALNPLDYTLLAVDEAWRRCALPSVDIHLHLVLDGRIDLDGLRRAVAALWRCYPAMSARLDRRSWWRLPTWRLPTVQERASATGRAIEVRTLQDDSRSVLENAWEALLSTRVDWTSGPALRAYVIRRPSAEDHVVLRWPHALMDARGGATMLEEISRLYAENPPLESLKSLGDELRRDFGVLDESDIQPRSPERTGSPAGRLLRMNDEPPQAGEKLRLMVRQLTKEATTEVLSTATRVCGFARVADHLRACGIAALHEMLGRRSDGCYSTQILIDNRKRRDRGPIGHNIFSTVPVNIPERLASDVATVADCIRDRTFSAMSDGTMAARLRGMRRLGRVPLPLLSRILAWSLFARKSMLPAGLTNAPSLPMGFMGPLSHATSTFCGASLINVFGARPASVRAGFAVNVNFAQERLNIAASYFEPRIGEDVIRKYIETYVTFLMR